MLDHGRIHATGAPDDVVREMRLTILHNDLEFAREEGSKEVEIVGVDLLRDGVPVTGAIPSGETLTIRVDAARDRPVEDPVVSFALHDATNAFVFGYDTIAGGLSLGTLHGTSRVRFEVGPIPVTGGKYLAHPGRAFTRQRARLPRPGRALFLRRPAGRWPARPIDIPRDHADGDPVTDTAPTETTQEEKGSRNMTIGLILVSVTLAAIAQVTLKAGMNHVTDANGGQLALSGDSLKQIAAQVWVWAGLAIFAVSAVLWLFALSRANLSFAYPFAALGYVIIVHRVDPVPERARAARHVGGDGAIVGGILLIAQGSPQG